MLRLQLEAIEARLKLKKLQQKKKGVPAVSGAGAQERPENLDVPAGNGKMGTDTGDGRLPESSKQSEPAAEVVQVQVSPRPFKPQEEQQKSPGRVLLGIDKGLKGKNVSLRNPQSIRSTTKANYDPFTTQSQHSQRPAPQDLHATNGNVERPKSFSERIAEIRKHDKDHKAKMKRVVEARSSGFGLSDKDLENYRERANILDSKDRSAKEAPGHVNSGGFSRDQILHATSRSQVGYSRRSQQHPDLENPTPSTAQSRLDSFDRAFHESGSSQLHPRRLEASLPRPSTVRPQQAEADEPSDTSVFDPYSSLYLSKRLIPHEMLTKPLQDKSVLTVASLLAAVKSPDYSLPDSLEVNFVIIGIIASKSSPLAHKNPKPNRSTNDNNPDSIPKTTAQAAEESLENDHGKYQVFTITDLKWSLDFYLFDTAFTRFRKLTPGTLIAILNPSIMPPPPGKSDTGRFSLTLNSSEDTILEIGTSRDLGFCKSVKKDGKRCSAWIDTRHTSVCEFHVDRILEKTRAGRMEVNTITTTYGPGGKSGGRTGFWGETSKGRFDKGKKSKDKNAEYFGPKRDWSTQSTYFVAPAIPGQSAARLLDNEASMERGGSAANKQERERKRLAQREQEREIARKLGQGGNGAGGEYLRASASHTTKQKAIGEAGGVAGDAAKQTRQLRSSGEDYDDEERQRVLDMEEAKKGLMGNKAGDVQLSPLKKRKLEWMVERDRERKRKKAAEEEEERAFGKEGGSREKAQEHGNGKADDDDDELELV